MTSSGTDVPDAVGRRDRTEVRRAAPSAATPTRSFLLAAIATGALLGVSLVLRLGNPFGATAPDVSDWVPYLWATGALVVVGLTRTWAPTLAWVSLIVAATASALAAAGLVREARVATGVEPTAVLAAFAVVALAVPPLIAAAYATTGGRRSRALLAAAWATGVLLGGWLLASLVGRAMDGERGGEPEWIWLGVIGALTVAGLVRDLAPAVTRTQARLRAGDGGSRSGRSAFTAVRVFVDELVPGREAGRAEAAESERGRLAADLHAEVLPSLRRALAEAEGGGTVERLAADLRTAVDEVEALLVSRRSIVLEEMGLLAAIEWLAERTEDRSDVRVEILVEGDEPAGRPPRDVERAAFRVAQLALDNVVRHAPGASAAVRIAAGPSAVRLRITDDGSGPPIDEAAAARAGRRGIADMRAEARACDASLAVGPADGSRGTAIDFRWPA